MIIDSNSPQDKREELMAAGYALFGQFGIKRVSIEEVCKAAQISKVTFYKHFRNKSDFAITIIRYLYEKGFELMTPLWESDRSFEEKLTETVIWKKELMEKYSFEFIKELMYSRDPLVNDFMVKMKEQSMSFFRKIFRRAQEEGEVAKDLSIDFLIAMLEMMQSSMENDNFVRLFKNPKEMHEQMFKLYYYGALSR